MSESPGSNDLRCPNCNALLTPAYARHGLCPACGASNREGNAQETDQFERHAFQLGEVLRQAWETFKARFGFFMALILVLIVLYGAPQLLSSALPDSSILLFSVLVMIYNILLYLGQTRIFLSIAQGKSPEFSQLVNQYEYFLPHLLASILFSLSVMAGLLLFIIPGIILMLQFMFFTYVIIDEDLGPMEALRRSSELTHGAKGQLFLFILATIAINFLGLLALGVGIFVTYPVIQMAQAYIYLELKASTEPNLAPEPEPTPTPATS